MNTMTIEQKKQAIKQVQQISSDLRNMGPANHDVIAIKVTDLQSLIDMSRRIGLLQAEILRFDSSDLVMSVNMDKINELKNAIDVITC